MFHAKNARMQRRKENRFATCFLVALREMKNHVIGYETVYPDTKPCILQTFSVIRNRNVYFLHILLSTFNKDSNRQPIIFYMA